MHAVVTMEVEIGEKVLVSTSGSIYEAVVHEVDESAEEPLMFVHYLGAPTLERTARKGDLRRGRRW